MSQADDAAFEAFVNSVDDAAIGSRPKKAKTGATATEKSDSRDRIMKFTTVSTLVFCFPKQTCLVSVVFRCEGDVEKALSGAKAATTAWKKYDESWKQMLDDSAQNRHPCLIYL